MDKTFDNGNFNRLQDTFIGSLLLFVLMSKMDDADWDLFCGEILNDDDEVGSEKTKFNGYIYLN